MVFMHVCYYSLLLSNITKIDGLTAGTLTVRQRKVTTKKAKALEINENANLVHAIPCSEQQPATFDSNHDLMLEMPKATDLSVLTNKTSSSTWDTSFFFF